MNPSSDFEREQALFERCLGQPETEWDNVLREHCEDPSLRDRVRRLLEHHREVPTAESGFLRLDGSDPERIGPYRILQRLGKGGMGIVYAAEQREPVRRRVAIKVLRDSFASREVLARFDVERQALALMNHPNIARILDAGTTADHRPFIVMEFVAGETITTFARRQALSLEQRLELFCQVCDAVQHAHQKGVIHRDIKPSNILVTEENGRAVPKVIDFGIAKAVAQRLTDHTLETKIGSLLGTPDYMSPEQIDLSPLDVDTRADVYALGAVLYELLCEAPPFRLAGLGFAEIQRIVRETEPAPPSSRVTGSAARALRGELDWVTQHALEKERSHRYGSVAELRDDVRRHLSHEATRAGPPSRLRHVKKFVQRHRVATAVASLAALAITALAAGMSVQAQWLAAERDRANREVAVSNDVTAFLVDLFQGGDPYAAGSRTVDATELLERGRMRIGEAMPQPSPARARIHRALGQVYINLGRYADAETLLARSLEDMTAVYGATHPETLETERQRLRLLTLRGHIRDALSGFEKLEADWRRHMPDDATGLAQVRLNLATALMYTGDFERALRLFLEAEPVIVAARGPDDAAALALRNNLGNVYESLGLLDQAIATNEALLPDNRRVFGSAHPRTLGTAFNLARQYGSAGRKDEMRATYEEVLAAQQERLGAEHPDTLLTRMNIALAAPTPAQAVVGLRDVLAIRERVLGSEHPDTVATRINIAAEMARDGGHLAERDRLLASSLATFGRLLEPTSESLTLTQVLLAEVRVEQQRHDEALELLRTAIANGYDVETIRKRERLLPLLETREVQAVISQLPDAPQ